MGRPQWQSARTAILATASLFQTNVILCQSWNTMLYFASFNYLTSPREGRERQKDCYLSRWLDCSRKCMWQYEKASWQQIKFSDEIIRDSLRKMFVTNKTGKSYYACFGSYTPATNFALIQMFVGLLREQIHFICLAKFTHSKSQLKRPNKHWGPHSHRATQQGAWGRLSCWNITQHLLGNITQMSNN